MPKFEFESFIVDLQHIYSGDMMKDARECEKVTQLAIDMERQKLLARGRVVINYYANLPPNMRIAFVQIVHLAQHELKLEPVKPVIPILIPGKD